MTLGHDKKIYIIQSGDYPMEKIVEELEAEGYPYHFHVNHEERALLSADEIWCFGKGYKLLPEYDTAVKYGKDIWVMG